MILSIQQASRAVLYVDPRADLRTSLNRIEAEIRRRIFDRGFNALDQQMPRALDRPSGRYRYRTGDLYNSLVVSQPVQGMLVMTFNYRDRILFFLEGKYGPIFRWSNNDITFVQDLVRAKLPANIVPMRPSSVAPVTIAPVFRPAGVTVSAPVTTGFDFTVSRSGQVIDVGEGLITVNGNTVSSRGMRFEVPARSQFDRYDAIYATPRGLEYLRGGNRPVQTPLNTRLLFVIFVPAEASEEEIIISEQI